MLLQTVRLTKRMVKTHRSKGTDSTHHDFSSPGHVCYHADLRQWVDDDSQYQDDWWSHRFGHYSTWKARQCCQPSSKSWTPPVATAAPNASETATPGAFIRTEVDATVEGESKQRQGGMRGEDSLTPIFGPVLHSIRATTLHHVNVARAHRNRTPLTHTHE